MTVTDKRVAAMRFPLACRRRSSAGTAQTAKSGTSWEYRDARSREFRELETVVGRDHASWGLAQRSCA
jgi:hypothetical protein